MALSQCERKAIKTLLARLSTEHIAKCHFRRPGEYMSSGYAAEVARATQVWRDSWILPILELLAGDDTEARRQGWRGRENALKELSR